MTCFWTLSRISKKAVAPVDKLLIDSISILRGQLQPALLPHRFGQRPTLFDQCDSLGGPNRWPAGAVSRVDHLCDLDATTGAGLTTNKRTLLVTSASLLVTSALLVVTRGRYYCLFLQ